MIDYLPQFVPRPVDGIHLTLLVICLAMLAIGALAFIALLIDYLVSFCIWWATSRIERRKERHFQAMRHFLQGTGYVRPKPTEEKPEEDVPPLRIAQ